MTIVVLIIPKKKNEEKPLESIDFSNLDGTTWIIHFFKLRPEIVRKNGDDRNFKYPNIKGMSDVRIKKIFHIMSQK